MSSPWRSSSSSTSWPADGGEGVERDLAGDREQLGGVVVGVVEPSEALGDEVLERGGRLQRTDEPPHTVEFGQDLGLAGGLHELAKDARVPHGRVSEASQRLGHDRPTEDAVQRASRWSRPAGARR